MEENKKFSAGGDAECAYVPAKSARGMPPNSRSKGLARAEYLKVVPRKSARLIARP